MSEARSTVPLGSGAVEIQTQIEKFQGPRSVGSSNRRSSENSMPRSYLTENL